jgi:exonuclease VII large subunit
MQKSQTNWLRDHMRDHITNQSALDSPENILSFQRFPNSKMNPGAAALDVVYQAAELIRDVDNYAAERHARAETLARQAIEKLKIAHDCVQSAESRRLAAEAGIKEFSDRLENELGVRLQEVEKVVEHTTSRIAAAEAQLSAAEQRARIAEARAAEAENALRRIEEAIRIQIVEKMPVNARRTAMAA